MVGHQEILTRPSTLSRAPRRGARLTGTRSTEAWASPPRSWPPCLTDGFQKELAFLSIDSSPSFVREPQGNGCAERFIRALEENLLWVRHFRTIDELRLALLEFERHYNHKWLIERHGYKTPTAVRHSFTASLDTAA